MRRALRLAAEAAEAGEAPVGALVLAPDGAPLAEAANRVERDRDPTAHAELLALRRAARALGTPRLVGCALIVSLEPCAMCAGAIAQARIGQLIFGAYDPKGGGVEHGARVFERATCHHRPDVIGGVSENEAAVLLRRFFRARR